jgi:hypothetical protein
MKKFGFIIAFSVFLVIGMSAQNGVKHYPKNPKSVTATTNTTSKVSKTNPKVVQKPAASANAKQIRKMPTAVRTAKPVPAKMQPAPASAQK